MAWVFDLSASAALSGAWEEIRQLMEILQKGRASHGCNIKAYIGNLDFLGLGSLALLQICCGLGQISLSP